MLAFIAIFVPAAIMVVWKRRLFNEEYDWKAMLKEYIVGVLLINFLVIAVAYIFFGSRGNVVGNLNTYNTFALKYIFLAIVLAVGMPWGWKWIRADQNETETCISAHSADVPHTGDEDVEPNGLIKFRSWIGRLPSILLGRRLTNTEMLVFWGVVLLSVARIWLAYNTPVYIVGASPHDDARYRDMAMSILDGEWLGTYSQYTLMKGITYGLFYVICIVTRIPYTILLMLLHIASALVLVRSIGGLLKFRYAGYIFYLVLIFSPATFSTSISQSLYRNALVVPLVLLIFAGMIGLYRNLDKWRSARRYSILAGVSLFLFWNLREDGIWIMPFVICAGIISFIFSVVSYRKSRDKKSLIKKTAFIILPLIILLAGNLLISGINYSYYGIFTRNDRTEGAFSDVVGLFIQIDFEEDDPDVDDSYCYMTYEKFEYIIEHSESLSTYKDILLGSYAAWADALFPDTNIGGDHIQWAFREGLRGAGFYIDAAETQAYLKQVKEELEEEISNGNLELKDGIFLSSSTKMLELSEIPGYFAKTVTIYLPAIILYSNTGASAVLSSGDESVIRNWEWRINSYALYPGETGDRLEYAERITSFENRIIKIYQVTALSIFALAVLSFLALTVLQILNIKRKDKELFDEWLIPCGAFLSAFLSLFIFTVFTSWNDGLSETYYCSGAFCLVQTFEMISICGALGLIVNFLKRKRTAAESGDLNGKENE